MFVLDWMAVIFNMSAAIIWTLSVLSPIGIRDRKKQRNEMGRDINAVLGGKPSLFPFGSRGYKALGDQEQTLLKAETDGKTAIEMAYAPEHSTALGPYTGRETGYGGGEGYDGGETAYEPYRHTKP
jgi:hypothetical protein